MSKYMCIKCGLVMKQSRWGIHHCVGCDCRIVEYNIANPTWNVIKNKDTEIRRLKSCLRLLGKGINRELKKDGIVTIDFTK